jgi:hypothetical protein
MEIPVQETIAPIVPAVGTPAVIPLVETPVVETPVVEAPVDIVTRVSKMKVSAPVSQTEDKFDKFNINELDAQIDKLPDPILKEQVLGLKKSLLRGENQKYQEIASLRKQYETELAQSRNWTPDRIQSLLKDEGFVKAAQSIVGSPITSQETSMLTETEKKVLEDNNRQVQALLSQNQQLLKSQQETKLKETYADYDPAKVDTFVQDFQTGKRQATYEDAWVLINWKNMVQRAYEAGKEDKQNENKERVAGMTFVGGGNIPQQLTIEKLKGETTEQFFRRSYEQHTQKK